jgi:DNA-binding transcriptional ArsR family regulator
VSHQSNIFRVVAEPTRRELLDLLLQGEKNAKQLCSHFSASQQSVSLHLQSLKRAGLVKVRTEGRFRTYRLKAQPIREIFEWSRKYESFFDPYGHAWSFASATPKRKSKGNTVERSRRLPRRIQ